MEYLSEFNVYFRQKLSREVIRQLREFYSEDSQSQQIQLLNDSSGQSMMSFLSNKGKINDVQSLLAFRDELDIIAELLGFRELHILSKFITEFLVNS